MKLPVIVPPAYAFTMQFPPPPEGVNKADWQPNWLRFELTYKGKELLRGTVAVSQLGQVQEQVDKTIANHQAQRRYDRSLAGVWNNYPVDWMWWLLQRCGFRYGAGGHSGTHTTHYFVRRFGQKGAVVIWKARKWGPAWPRAAYWDRFEDMMTAIEHGQYQ